MGAPEKFETRPEAVRVTPARTITHPQTGAVIKEIPEQRQVTPGQTAYEQLQGYLKERAHPQEVEWVLGNQFADAPAISRTALQEAFQKNRINLETQRHGGSRDPRFIARATNPDGAGWLYSENTDELGKRYGSESKDAAITRLTALGIPREAIQTKAIKSYEHGPLAFPDMLIPGGKNATEVPIRLQGGGFPDSKGHFGDDVVAWTIHDQRKMPDGKTATFVQELQSDWHQQGAKEGYGVPPTRKEISDAIFDSVADQWVMIDKYGSVRTGMDMLEKIPRIADELDFSQRVKDLFHKTKLTPDAPFKGNEWTKLGIKQALADAIERGDDYVLFPPPELVSRTQGMPIEKARKFYGEIVPNLVNEMLKQHGVKLEKMPLPGTKMGKKEFIASNTKYSMEDLRLASKDQIDELAAKAGYSGQQQHEVYGFTIPDAMKKQAQTKGFPLMSVAPFAAAAGGGALARVLQSRQEQASQQGA